MRILIAEDDPVSCRILEHTLVTWGYEVIVTRNGQEALDALTQKDAPNLAILDIMMPGIDGLEICRSVRKLPYLIPPYLILLTAISGKDNVVKGIEAGANDYLTKPFHRAELKVRVGVGVHALNLQQALNDRVKELEETLARVTQLQGMLPICSYCKQVRDDQNYWQEVESYIATHADVQFSHGICPDCFARVSLELKVNRQKKEERV